MLYRALRTFTFVAYLTLCSVASATSPGSAPAADKSDVADGSSVPRPLYDSRTLWTTQRGPIPAAEQALTILREAQSHGLRAEHYQIEELSSLHERVSQGHADLREEYEGLMTDALLRLFRDLRPQLVQDNSSGSGGIDLFELIVTEAVASDTLPDFYQSLLPRHKQYQALRSALATEEAREEQAAAAANEIGRGQTLRIGDTGSRVSALRARLNVEKNAASDAVDVFDEQLEAAVIAYQTLHGLEADGMVGRRTQQHLDMSAAERAARIRVALARWRDLPTGLGDDYVHVNIPEYRLEMIRNGQPHVEM